MAQAVNKVQENMKRNDTTIFRAFRNEDMIGEIKR